MAQGLGYGVSGVPILTGSRISRIPTYVDLHYISGFGVRVLGFGVWGLGFGVWGLGFEAWGMGFGVWGLRFGVWGLGFSWRAARRIGREKRGCMVQGSWLFGCKVLVPGSGFRVQGSEFRVPGSGFRIEGWKFRVYRNAERASLSSPSHLTVISFYFFITDKPRVE